MTTAFKHRNLPRLLLQAREAVMAHTRPSLRGHGLSDQQWRVLRVLGEHGTVETGRVAREAFILGPSLTGVLARKEHKNHNHHEHDPQDQRRTVVEASAKGMKLVGRLSRTVESHYAWLEQEIGGAKLAQLYRLLDEVIALEGAAPEHSRVASCESTTSSTASRSRAATTSRA